MSIFNPLHVVVGRTYISPGSGCVCMAGRASSIFLCSSHILKTFSMVCAPTLFISTRGSSSFTMRSDPKASMANYDQYVKTREEVDENQMKRYNWEQDQTSHMKDYIYKNLEFGIDLDTQVALVGPNGAGKSLMGEVS
ncbi:uncharacterized protein LOC127449809 [Myxocyprinus asiaticus]|uniref:uncharacterized protein LOC127449809 n=1 Tax=Myxocyprinus asiaticus TaxID=70543 RepID=UPI002222770A|nr:uncharacterized protein LOC127449809 [Myxocyprinus asiaticus]